MALTETTAATQEPLTLDEVKDHLRVDGNEEDAYIKQLMVAARCSLEAFTNRRFITATLKYSLDDFPGSTGMLLLPAPPLQSVTSILYYDDAGDQQTLSANDYQVDTESEPGRIIPAYGETWPSTRTRLNAVEVNYVAGYGDDQEDVPDAIKTAIEQWVAMWYENREPFVTGTIATRLPDVVSALTYPYRVMEW